MKSFALVFLMATSMAFAADTKNKTASPAAAPVAPAVAAPVASTSPSVTHAASEDKFEETALTKSTALSGNGKSFELKPVSHGLRKKKVFGLVPVKVYLIEFLSANPTKLVKTDEGILPSLKTSEAAELKLTLLRDLGGKKITDSFTESLHNNGIDTNNLSTEMAAVMAELSTVSEFKKGETFSLLATWKDTDATLFIQKPDGSIKTITGNEKFVTDLFSIWFGKPADEKMIELKKTLLK